SHVINLKKSVARKSHFLFGPRATGKSWLIKHELPEAQLFDLLNTNTHDRLLRRPSSLAEEIQGDLVVIDEIQKVPRLLDEVHRLIEERGTRFLLTGSSARKLKHGAANLLAGRARSLQLFPLVSQELTDFDLLKYCRYGGLPLIYQSDEPWRDLKEYIHLYMKEEITAEAVVRRVDHYARFLDIVGRSSGEELNYQQVASDSGVPPRTVANFVEVLKDTLLAFELEPLRKTKKRKGVSKSKLFLFDVGVANYLSGRKELLPRSEAFGKAFEHFLIQELRAYLGYHQVDEPMMYWRAVSGQFEVDCVVGNQVAIEVKSTDRVQERMLTGLRALKEEKLIKNFYLVSQDPERRVVDGIQLLPYQEFLKRLWQGELISS
ncbi:MAG: AAA family ATPase, partial [Oligoflexia bacterium]|nr:AAA family ATPase [Oligoflexia bacterium]